MKRFMALILALSMLLAACSSSRQKAAEKPSAATGAQTATPAKGTGILVIGSGQDVSNLDPHTGYDYAIRAIQRNVYDALFKYVGPEAKIVPWLAESYEASPDARTYTIKLDKRAKFQNGDPVDAEAVKYSFNRMLKHKKGISWMFTGVMDENSVQVVDPHTVKITLTKPFAPFISTLPWLWIVNPKEVKAHEKNGDDGQDWLKDHSAGSGPFKIKRWEPGTLYELERDPNYWRGWGDQYLDGVIWKIIRESQSQKLALQKGEIHFALNLSPEDFDQIKSDSNVVTVEYPGFRGFYIKFNTQKGPTADVHVRRAISYAMDYEAMIKATNGHAQLLHGPIPTSVAFHDPKIEVYRKNLEKAKAELAKSQYPNGGFELEYVHVTGLEVTRQHGLILMDALKPLNINVKITAMVWPDIVARAKSPDTQPAMYAVYQTANYNDPDNAVFPAYHSSQYGTWSAGTYKNPEVDKLIDKARGTVDKKERQEAYSQLQKLLVEDAPDIFGTQETVIFAHRKELGGYVFTPLASNAFDFYPLYLKK